MPKAAPPKRVTWRLWAAIAVGITIFVSTGLAARRMKSVLQSDDRFFLASGVDGGAPGIRLEGNRYATRDRILSVFANDVNHSVFSIPLAERRRKLLAIDWIEEASVLRIWPNQLIVKVRERKPVAFVKLPIGISGQFRYELIDEQGVLLSVPRKHFDFPVLTGVSEDQTEPDRRVRVLAMEKLLRELGPSALSTVSEVNASSPKDMRVQAKLGGRTLELWLGDRNFKSRIKNFTNHLDEIVQKADDATVFDLRIDDRFTSVR